MANHSIHESSTYSLTTPTLRAFQILHIGFTLIPVLAGFDKFTHFFVNWNLYLSPAVINVLPVDAHYFMKVVGVIEIAAGLLLYFKPRIGAYVVMVWLWGIIINLLSMSMYYDIALRDFGLSLGALALAKLAEEKAL